MLGKLRVCRTLMFDLNLSILKQECIQCSKKTASEGYRIPPREVTEFTSGEGPGIFVRRGENFDEAPPAGGVNLRWPPPARGEKF